jgi:Co/Zn/Cd efflux system component
MTWRRLTAAALAALCAFLPSSEGWAAGARAMGGAQGPTVVPAVSVPMLSVTPPGFGAQNLSGASRLSILVLPGVPVLPASLPASQTAASLPAPGAQAGLGLPGARATLTDPQVLEGPAQPPKTPLAAQETPVKDAAEPGPGLAPDASVESAADQAAGLFENSRRGRGGAGVAEGLPTRREALARWVGLLSGYRAVRSVAGYPAVERAVDDLLNRDAPAADRREAARRLAALNRPETLEALASAATTDENPVVRDEARSSVASVGRSWQRWLLRESALHPLPGRRLAALRALGAVARVYEAPAAVDRLAAAAARDRDESARLTALQQLAHARSPKAALELARLQGRPGERELAAALEKVQPRDGEREDARKPLYLAALKKVIGIGAFFATIELVGGFVTRSMSLQADAMHLAADLAINSGALVALWLARRPAVSRRASARNLEPIVGLVSALAIAGMGLFTGVEAAGRLLHPAPVPALETMVLACAGLMSNAMSTWLLYRYREESLSLKGAFIHSATDAIGSLGIILGSALILAFGWLWADPVISFLIVGLILHTTWELAARSWTSLRAKR